MPSAKKMMILILKYFLNILKKEGFLKVLWYYEHKVKILLNYPLIRICN